MVAISRHLLWLTLKTTKRPATSEFLQLFRTSAKFFHSAFLAILYHALRDAPHSLCLAVASRIAFRLTIRMRNLRNLRSACQAEIRIRERFGLLSQDKECAAQRQAVHQAERFLSDGDGTGGVEDFADLTGQIAE